MKIVFLFRSKIILSLSIHLHSRYIYKDKEYIRCASSFFLQSVTQLFQSIDRYLSGDSQFPPILFWIGFSFSNSSNSPWSNFLDTIVVFFQIKISRFKSLLRLFARQCSLLVIPISRSWNAKSKHAKYRSKSSHKKTGETLGSSFFLKKRKNVLSNGHEFGQKLHT